MLGARHIGTILEKSDGTRTYPDKRGISGELKHSLTAE